MNRFFAIFYRCEIDGRTRFGTAYATTEDGSFVSISSVIKFIMTQDEVKDVAATNIYEFKSYEDFVDCQK